MMAPPALIRPSQLARFWELNARTLHIWIREGRLLAIRSPGNHFRLRVADVLSFCEREGLPVPPFVSPAPQRVVVGAASPALRRALARSVKTSAVIHALADPYEALVAAAAEPPKILALGVRAPQFDGVAAIRALRSSPVTRSVVVVAFDVPTRTHAAAMKRAGASQAIVSAQTSDLLPAALGELLEPRER
jgi:CheY-like chemotaxis protein